MFRTSRDRCSTPSKQSPHVSRGGTDLGAVREDEGVTDVAFRDVAVPDHLEAIIAEPAEVGVGVSVVPEHRCAEVILDARPTSVPDDREEETAGAERLPDTGK